MISVVKIIRDSRRFKKPKFFNDNKHLIIFAPIDIKFSPAELSRIGTKIVIDLLKNFSAFLLSKKKNCKIRITKMKRLFLNFINTSFIKTFIIQKIQPIGFISIDNNKTDFKTKHETSQIIKTLKTTWSLHKKAKRRILKSLQFRLCCQRHSKHSNKSIEQNSSRSYQKNFN